MRRSATSVAAGCVGSERLVGGRTSLAMPCSVLPQSASQTDASKVFTFWARKSAESWPKREPPGTPCGDRLGVLPLHWFGSNWHGPAGWARLHTPPQEAGHTQLQRPGVQMRFPVGCELLS